MGLKFKLSKLALPEDVDSEPRVWKQFLEFYGIFLY